MYFHYIIMAKANDIFGTTASGYYTEQNIFWFGLIYNLFCLCAAFKTSHIQYPHKHTSTKYDTIRDRSCDLN